MHEGAGGCGAIYQRCSGGSIHLGLNIGAKNELRLVTALQLSRDSKMDVVLWVQLHARTGAARAAAAAMMLAGKVGTTRCNGHEMTMKINLQFTQT